MTAEEMEDIAKLCKAWIKLSDAYSTLKRLAIESADRSYNDSRLLNALSEWLTDNHINPRDVDDILHSLSENITTVYQHEKSIKKLSKLLHTEKE